MSEVAISLKKLHPAQEQIIAEAKKYNVLKCGRRFGKTELTKELAINPMLDGFPVGYWCPTYKDLHDVWNELKFTLYPVIRSSSEQVKQITLVTGGKLDMWSMDEPNNGRGRKYKRVIIDEAEKSRNFEQAWTQAIHPTLLDYQGDAWFMSTPKFGQTYFKEIFKNKEKYDDWNSWLFTSYDNPYMPKEEIDAYKKQYDELTFACEFLAQDVDITNNPFAYAFDPFKHLEKVAYDKNKPLQISFDFNVDPITAIAGQEMNIISEFRLTNSDIYELCDRIIATYPSALYIITGDATGHNRSALAKGNINYYTVIKQKFKLADGQMKQPGTNPAVSDSRVLLNSMLQNAAIKINPDNCPYLIQDLKFVEVDANGDIEKGKDKYQSHLLDCARYYFATYYRNFLKTGM